MRVTWGPAHKLPPEYRPAKSQWTWGQPGPSSQTGMPSPLQETQVNHMKVTKAIKNINCMKAMQTFVFFQLNYLEAWTTCHHPPSIRGHCCLWLHLSYLPDKSPATKVEMIGVFLALTRARNEKSRPSRAIAKIMRGSGNMEPRRLSQG